MRPEQADCEATVAGTHPLLWWSRDTEGRGEAGGSRSSSRGRRGSRSRSDL